MTYLHRDLLQLAELLATVSDPEHGGNCLFSGSTRREAASEDVRALIYEADEDLAEREIGRIIEEARERFGARAAAQHRLGRVEAGEVSVAVASSAPHRDNAFLACRYLIDEIKSRVPIWKQAEFADGRTRWDDGRTG